MPPHVRDRILIVEGDITKLDVDAVVDAANESLLGGGGVDGAIHRAAGPELLAECRALHGCPTGLAKITRGHRLKARHVIHTVGPIYDGGYHEADLLRSCYVESLRLAAEHRLYTIAFPCISTGIYGYPKDKACDIAISTAIEWLATHEHPHTTIFCCFDSGDTSLYQARLASST
jgi:O-acetyl-ADP-ribose deacetylase (regulator of RNase III)